MCNAYCTLFGALNLKKEEIQGRKVIEVGSMDVNGSLRPLLESFKPKQYVGVDISKGRGVDIICNAEDLLDKFEKDSFDVLISTELLEHVRNWKKVISNFKNIVKTAGMILITTRSRGFPYHGYPYDFWRYEIEDMESIFSDCIIEKLEKDPTSPGVFIKVRKPRNFVEKDLSNYKLHSVIFGKRTSSVSDEALRRFYTRFIVNQRLKALFPSGAKVAKIVKRKSQSACAVST